MYKDVDMVVRDLTTVVEVRLTPGIALIIQDPAKVLTVNGASVAYTTLADVYSGLTGDINEFEYKS